MWFVREDEAFVAWFLTKRTTGVLRTGLIAGDFVATVIDPTDSATTTPAVSESTTKPGLYTFTVPTAFIATNGVGNYGIVVEINTKVGPSGAPHVVDAFASVLVVSTDDFNTIGANAALVPTLL